MIKKNRKLIIFLVIVILFLVVFLLKIKSSENFTEINFLRTKINGSIIVGYPYSESFFLKNDTNELNFVFDDTEKEKPIVFTSKIKSNNNNDFVGFFNSYNDIDYNWVGYDFNDNNENKGKNNSKYNKITVIKKKYCPLY